MPALSGSWTTGGVARPPRHLGTRPGDKGITDIPPGQPLRLRLLRAILEAAGDPDRDFLRRAEQGLPLKILEGLPRTPHVFEEQTSWRLDITFRGNPR